MLSHSEIHHHELERIREEYARRAREIPEDFYSLDQEGNLFAYLERTREVIQTLKHQGFFPLKGKEILEIGCGTGDWLVDFERWGAEPQRLHGIDLDEKQLEQARCRLTNGDLRVGEASQAPWDAEQFDLVLRSTVFTSILDDGLRQAIANEMLRVLKPNGVILWYDFHCNNPWNPHVRGIGACEIKELFPSCVVNSRRITLAPPISRWLAPRSWLVCYLLEQIRILNTHYLAVIKKSHGLCLKQ